MAVLSRAEGVSVVQESIYDNRLAMSRLVKMGANIKVEGKTAIVEGVPRLVGALCEGQRPQGRRQSHDSRPSADGVTEVYGLEIISRGYEIVDEKLRGLGHRWRSGLTERKA